MKFRLGTLLAAAMVTAAIVGCGDGQNDPQDTIVTYDLLLPDVGGNDTVDALTNDTGDDLPMSDEGGTDTTVDQGGTPDTLSDPGQPDTNPVDTYVPPEDTYVPPSYECNSIDDCQPYEVCDLALGRCEERSSYPLIVGNEDLFSFKPPEGGYGDFVVIDGSRFMYGTTSAVRADIGGSLVASATLAHSTISPHRIIGPVPTEGGKVGVVFQQASPIYQKFPTEFIYNTNLGVIECNDSTPPATGTNGSMGEVGPFGAGYVDLVNDDIRIYYPAECGSIRRPGVPGTYPVVVIVPEGADINVPFLNFDYIGQMLASWGIVTVSMKAEVNTEDTEAHLQRVIATAPGFKNADLSAKHAALEGVQTSDKFAWLVFGSGADTMNLAFADEAGNVLDGLALATVAIAPAAKLNDNGSSSFMVVYGKLDKIASNNFATGSFGEFNSPKWQVEIKGGNHSLFTDHQMYYGDGIMPITDNDPEIMRKEQMSLTLGMVLPFLQKAFGMTEPFADQLASSFSTDKIAVQKN